MGKVNFLSENIINKISAGQVIENPSSVLKELIENSIDANSKKIEVNIENSGRKLISVKDDGEGIEPDDIEKIFERYTTSKIKEINDLYKIKTLGFRGEALYSIGAVSDVILKSKAKNFDIGKEIHIRGGKKLNIKDSIVPDGTIVEVRELFFNTPARKKFLKSDMTEFRRILNVFIPYTIVFFKKTFIFKNEDTKIIHILPTEDILKRFCEVLNIQEKYLIYEKKHFEKIEFEIILGDMNLKRNQKDMQFVFVNNRPVYNYTLSSSVNNFYQKFFSSEFFPVFALFLKLPFEDIDVNIHPTKREVKIKNENEIGRKIVEILDEIFKKGQTKIVEVDKKYEKIEEIQRTENIKEKIEIFDFKEQKTEIFEEKVSAGLIEKLKNASYIGTFKNKYLIFEFENSLLFIDQHAAVERINYEKFLNEIETGKINIQQLLTPIIINLNQEEIFIYEKIEKIIEEFGFITTRWSENKIAIHGYPSLIKDIEFSIRNILSEKDIKKYDKDSVAKRACRNSVMAGQKLTNQEVKYIIENLIECKNPFVCPHGRPIVIEISEKFLDSQFLR
ncbi:MAG: DNA mismatch repair endonuclease MutL [Candidatus Omnitrophica bacterium]|nr:DNA mismatch repair endonuclease MutL [Candidatus Omnitrophota bacterium]